MIEATRLDGAAIMVNADLIETVESVPDTVITLSTGRRLVVRESVADIVDRAIRYQQRVRRSSLGLASSAAAAADEAAAPRRSAPATQTDGSAVEVDSPEMGAGLETRRSERTD